ncbi:hypothetical protein M101_5085 [Bacteroides fragilis str. 1007-1-F |nr:hypothetical protein M101_5085 [Bacteroides fragilis str. 1007-1-F \
MIYGRFIFYVWDERISNKSMNEEKAFTAFFTQSDTMIPTFKTWSYDVFPNNSGCTISTGNPSL